VGLLLVNTIDNVLKPLLISQGAQMPLSIIFMGVIGGLLAWGLLGLFIGPTLLAWVLPCSATGCGRRITRSMPRTTDNPARSRKYSASPVLPPYKKRPLGRFFCRTLRLQQFQRHRRGLATANAQAGHATFATMLAQGGQQVTITRAPDAPIGWPSAQAPPCTFTLSCGRPDRASPPW
jgi:hypothetical protein